MNPYRFFITKKVFNQQLVRQVDRRHNRELLMVAATALLLVAAVLTYGWQHFEMIRNGYQLEELRIEREKLLKIHRQLALERSALASPDRIEAIATRRLGMAPPDDGEVVAIEPEPAPAEGEDRNVPGKDETARRGGPGASH